MEKHPLLGLVVEGQTEYEAIPGLLHRLGVRFTLPSVIGGQRIEAALPVLVERRLLRHVRVQLAKKADKVAVILDLESRNTAAHVFRQQLRDEIRRQVAAVEGKKAALRIEAFVCDRSFENWLIADPQGIKKSEYIVRDLSRIVDCHGDGRDALSLLKSALRPGAYYQKTVHGPRLAKSVRVEKADVHLCSKSLREFVAFVRPLASPKPSS